MTTPNATPTSSDACLARAWGCFDKGRLDDAVQLVRQALEQNPVGRPDCDAALGWFLLSLGAVSEAELTLASSLVRHPEYAPLHWYIGLVYFRERRLEEACRALSTAVRLNPELDEAAVSLAWVLNDLGRFDEATFYSRQALTLKAQPDRIAQLGWLLFRQEKWEEAVSQLMIALSLQPERVDICGNLSTALQRLGRNEDALKVLSDGLVVFPDAPDLLHKQISLLLCLRRTKLARVAIHRLLTLQPQDGACWCFLSQVLLQRQRFAIAALALGRARRLAPALPEVWRQSGWLAQETGNLHAAQQAVECLLVLVPEDPETNILAAVVLEASGNLQAASQYAEKAVACSERSADAWRALAKVRARQSRMSEAEEALHIALDLDPDNANGTYRQLGWVCLANCRHEDAVISFTAAINNDESDSLSWYGLAEARRSGNQFVEALGAIQRALLLKCDWKVALDLRGRILSEQIDDLMTQNLLNFSAFDQVLPNLGHGQSEQLLFHDGKSTGMHRCASEPVTTKGAEYDYVLCSFCTRSHLPLLRTLAASARKHFSGRIFLLLIDSDDPCLIPDDAVFVRMNDVIDPSIWREMAKRYNTLEMCCVLKPFLMRFLAKTECCPVVYLDADTYLLGPLNLALPNRPDFSVFLTPHLLFPIVGERHVEEVRVLRVGAYNAGIIGVGVSDDAMRFLDWWADRVCEYAYAAPEQGVFTDQKWIDLVPSFFRGVFVSRDNGLNVGPWRINEENDFSEDSGGRLLFCGEPVTLMHLSRFNPEKPSLLASYLPLSQTHDSPLGRFLRRYALEVIQNKFAVQ